MRRCNKRIPRGSLTDCTDLCRIIKILITISSELPHSSLIVVHVPSEMIPTPLAIALAVIG